LPVPPFPGVHIMTITIENITNPGEEPVAGDLCKTTGDGFSYTQEFFPNTDDVTALAGPVNARNWRDGELQDSDWIIPVSDHPQHAVYVTYRAALRVWPSTSDFPDTKPELGS